MYNTALRNINLLYFEGRVYFRGIEFSDNQTTFQRRTDDNISYMGGGKKSFVIIEKEK